MAIKEYDIKNKKRNLDIEAQGIVKSTKHFPVFYESNKEKIFKPLSKTKPYSTPLFAYSEVYWSYFINKYIDNTTPVYKLAICHGLSNEQEKYYDKGTIVDNVLKEDERLISILEIFKRYPDKEVNINKYINYCEKQYDYEKILRSKFFQENPKLGEDLARQILCSILRRDDNFHYENVNFIEKNNKIVRIAPMMDMEFSQMFMFPDDIKRHREKFTIYDENMEPDFSYDDDVSFEQNCYNFLYKSQGIDVFDPSESYYLRKNIYTITKLYPKMCKKFLKDLQILKNAVFNTKIEFDNSYIGKFSSKDWKPTRMLYKEGYKEDDIDYKLALKEAENSRVEFDPVSFNKVLKKEVIWSIDKLSNTINLYLNFQSGKTSGILYYENKKLYEEKEEKNKQKIKE